MTGDKPAPKGGTREGAGRPSVDPSGAPSVRVYARLSGEDAELYRELGAARWLREQLQAIRLTKRQTYRAR